MTDERVAELLSPFLGTAELSTDQLEQVKAYLELLTRWNAKINLTAIRDREGILTRHFGESLFSARYLIRDSRCAQWVTDVGSGAGFPGMPLKIWAPNIHLTLIDSNQKKSVFLNEVIRRLKLSQVTILRTRIEEVSTKADLVTLRAVEHYEKVLPLLPNLLTPHAQIGLLIGESQAETAKAILKEIRWFSPLTIPLSRNRVLLIGESATSRLG